VPRFPGEEQGGNKNAYPDEQDRHGSAHREPRNGAQGITLISLIEFPLYRPKLAPSAGAGLGWDARRAAHPPGPASDAGRTQSIALTRDQRLIW
jgi:hypothetical protein